MAFKAVTPIKHVTAAIIDPRACKACLQILFGSPAQQSGGIAAMWDNAAWEDGSASACLHHGEPTKRAGMSILGTVANGQRIAKIGFNGSPAEMLLFAQNFVAAYNESIGYREEAVTPVSNKMLDAVKPEYRPLPQGRAYNPDVD